MWFDSHCHLDFAAFAADRELVWERARAAGVTRAFVPGVEPGQWPRLEALQAECPGIRVGVGIHPHHLEGLSAAEFEAALEALPDWFARLRAVAVGECGLDRPHAKRGGATMQRQLETFERQLGAARELDAPLVVHVVGAHGIALDVCERLGPLPAGSVLHSYSGPGELVPRYARLGLHFGFSAAVCQPRARRAKEALRAVPLERLLLETDAPAQPVPGAFRGVRNEPAELVTVAATVAALRGLSVAELARVTTENAERVFGERRAV